VRRALALFGALALLPAMTGPLEAEARAFMAPVCGGGAMPIPLTASGPGRDAPAGPQQGPCCAKGCHSDTRRKRLDRSQ